MENKTFNLKNLEAYLVDRLKNKPEGSDSYGLNKYSPRKLTWEGACSILEISKEEYDKSTRLYQIGYSLTGLGGWNLFWEQVREQSKTFSQ